MLRTSARSLGLNYRRRFWEVSSISSVTSSGSSASCERGGEYLPSRNSLYEGFSGYYSSHKFTDKKSPSAPPSQKSENIQGPAFQHSNFLHPRLVLRSLVYDESDLRGSLRSIDSSVNPSRQWTLGQAVRLMTSKAGAGDERKSSNEDVESGGPESSKPAATAPHSIEDFQHEEIVGPTVERDLSDTAEQVRESLATLKSCMSSFGVGFVLLGTVQLLTAMWGALILKADSMWLWRDLPFVAMSYTFAYLLWNAGSAMDFFAKMEGRSRLKILTLSLQVIKGLSEVFYRSGVVVKFVTVTSLLALMKQAFPLS